MLFINGERIWNKPSALFSFLRARLLGVNNAIKETRGVVCPSSGQGRLDSGPDHAPARAYYDSADALTSRVTMNLLFSSRLMIGLRVVFPWCGELAPTKFYGSIHPCTI